MDYVLLTQNDNHMYNSNTFIQFNVSHNSSFKQSTIPDDLWIILNIQEYTITQIS